MDRIVLQAGRGRGISLGKNNKNIQKCARKHPVSRGNGAERRYDGPLPQRARSDRMQGPGRNACVSAASAKRSGRDACVIVCDASGCGSRSEGTAFGGRQNCAGKVDPGRRQCLGGGFGETERARYARDGPLMFRERTADRKGRLRRLSFGGIKCAAMRGAVR